MGNVVGIVDRTIEKGHIFRIKVVCWKNKSLVLIINSILKIIYGFVSNRIAISFSPLTNRSNFVPKIGIFVHADRDTIRKPKTISAIEIELKLII